MHRTRTIDYAVVLSGEGEGEPPKADVPAKPRRARPEASLRPCRQWPRASKYRNAQEGRYDHNMVALAGHDRVLCGEGPAARLIDRAR
jgi:hypothetical protein